MHARALVALLFVLLVCTQTGTAADGDLDPAFGTGGKVVTTLADHADAADVAIQDDGKIVVIGTLGGTKGGRQGRSCAVT